MIREYRSEHLKQQAGERAHVNRNRQLARDKEQVFIFGDFMSEWATKLPHFRWQDRTSKEDAGNSIGQRLYAAEVIYGEIEGFICYIVDGFLPGGMSYYLHSHLLLLTYFHSIIGANIVVELTKRVIEDMNEMIKEKYKCDLPPVLCLQYDNGSECKNYTLFTYVSLLVELNMFTKIYVNYLIAGILSNTYFQT